MQKQFKNFVIASYSQIRWSDFIHIQLSKDWNNSVSDVEDAGSICAHNTNMARIICCNFGV